MGLHVVEENTCDRHLGISRRWQDDSHQLCSNASHRQLCLEGVHKIRGRPRVRGKATLAGVGWNELELSTSMLGKPLR